MSVMRCKQKNINTVIQKPTETTPLYTGLMYEQANPQGCLCLRRPHKHLSGVLAGFTGSCHPVAAVTAAKLGIVQHVLLSAQESNGKSNETQITQ